MGRAALLAERSEDVSHFDPLQSRKNSRTPESRCKLWPSNSFPELESSAVPPVANRQTRPPGLLRGSFRPPDVAIALRAYLRQRLMLISYASTHIQHMQKALEQMNVKLAEVVSDITGLTGMRIITAILEGQRDPAVLAALRDVRCKNDEATIARALVGTWRDEHLFELRQAYELYRV